MSASVPSYRLYREKSGESADFWIHSETIPERTHLHKWEISAHRHDSFFQIFHYSAGQGEILTDDMVIRFGAPCMVFIPPGAVHGFSYTRDVDGIVLTALADRLTSLSAADRHVAAFADRIRVIPISGNDANTAFALDCATRLHRELSGRARGRLLLLEPLMTTAIVALARCSAAVDDVESEVGDRDRRRMDELVTLIAAHFRQHKPIGFYAAAIGVSAPHLNRMARKSTGFSVKGLIGLRIMEAARRDLIFTPTPVQDIAYSLGFSDPAYFNRFIRKQTGMTPGAFRDAERRKLVS